MLNLLFLASNAIGSLVCLKLGFPYYGLGYFAACILTFVAALLVTAFNVRRLPYLTFIGNNPSVR